MMTNLAGERRTNTATHVESMFDAKDTRKNPWDGLGKEIAGAVTSKDAIRLAGLDWRVVSRNVKDGVTGIDIPNWKANVRDIDNNVLGMVSGKYQIVQNEEAFAFTDALLGEGVRYETAGSLCGGRRVWMLAKLEGRDMAGEKIDPYLVFTNSHDGKGSVKVAMTPIRVWCSNTLNLALGTAERKWSCTHMGDIGGKLEDARLTIMNSEKYLSKLNKEFERLKLNKITKDKMFDFTKELLPIDAQKDSANKVRIITEEREMLMNCWDAPDLQQTENSMFKFVNAVSDFSTHKPARRITKTGQENRFMKIVEGDNLIDQAYKIAQREMLR
ncbi:DUF932 domain-containing protein [Blautia intestinalis]|uniref:DUF932 domain-containing protein n=1 Tax=Blautia intestinalis TaxID=2763028 RepID=UPI0022E69AAE|nr:DUF932 domain-containing protein [Blautia intestinalis]